MDELCANITIDDEKEGGLEVDENVHDLLCGSTSEKVKKARGICSWVNFKYERLPIFYYYCGIMGHTDSFCALFFKKGDRNAKPYGLFLKAFKCKLSNQVGEMWLRNWGPNGGAGGADEMEW
ncbi:conserved hypothetical protein [Ricinus communis]|uniref:Zinc knuckle CX2CX4HX4C domain-containing protein n=1 Tax=Ricinus communis TaxID=3988 RepID=B9SN24_RICCO|nr:conserved hypothetical protein [Ricinus communis]